MTTHLDEELLAQWVIDGEPADDAAADHLRLCGRCRDSLRGLREVAGQVHDLPRMDTPPADVWDRIRAELDLETPYDRSISDVPALEPRRVRPPVRRKALAIAAGIAAVAGIGVGVAGTLVATSNDPGTPTTEANVRLAPLAGKSGDGNADLVSGTSGTQLRVTVTGLANTPGFYEVWLINEDGKRMISLGVLNPSTGGTFQIPSDLTGQGYRIVDISLEPDDGNPEHSHDSIIRGTLPS